MIEPSLSLQFFLQFQRVRARLPTEEF